jgi:predicted oxidoreductase
MGIDLKVTLYDNQVRLYILNKDSIRGGIGLDYVNKSQRLAECWYAVDK